MNERIMMDGEPLNVGDEVYCILTGDGVVDTIGGIEEKFPVLVNFNGFVYKYTADFKSHEIHKNRVLYRQKPEIIPPPKRKKKVKVWDWFVEWKNGGTSRLYRITEDADLLTVHARLAQKIDGTEREIEV